MEKRNLLLAFRSERERAALAEAFSGLEGITLLPPTGDADAVLRLCQSVTNGLHVNEKIVERTLREYLPFLATENIMMEAVKRGGDRQELHEKIRQHSMAATARMKEGEPCDLLDRLAGDPAFGMTREELDQVMEPKLYIGRCEQQVLRFLDECAPLLRDAAAEDGAIDL